MDLNKHGYWLGMGAAAAVALIAYAAFVPLTVGADIRKKEGELRKKVKQLESFARKPDDQVGDVRSGLPIAALRDYWTHRQKALKTEYDRIRAEFEKLDAELESVTGGYASDPTRFAGEMNRDLGKLDDDFKDLLPAGKKFNEVAAILSGEVTVDQISSVQKRYYIGRAIAQAALAAGARKIVSITFEEPPARPAGEDPSRVSVDVRAAKAVLLMPLGGLDHGKRRAQVLRELQLPDEGPRGLAVLVSALVRHPRVVMRVGRLNVQAHPFEVPELEPWKVFPQKSGGFGAPAAAGPRKSFDQDVYIATQDDSSKEAKEPPPELREPDVEVTVEVEALDFRIPGGGDGR